MPLSVIGTSKGFATYGGPIRFQPPRGDIGAAFTTIPIEWLDRPDRLADLRSIVEGRYVFVGGAATGEDLWYTPLSPGVRLGGATDRKVYGVEILAHMTAQALDGFQYRPLPEWTLWLVMLAAVAIGAANALLPVPAAMSLAVVALFAFPFGVPIVLISRDYDVSTYPAIGTVIAGLYGWIVVSAIARSVSSDQRRYAHSALGKYLPADVAREILKSPERLKLSGERRDLYVIFTDLEGFTELSSQSEPEVIAKYINGYLSALSRVVLEHGGTIDKFVGDALVAFWGAPIRRADDGDRALRAVIALAEVGEAFRHTVGADAPLFGRTRVGLHFGSSLVGNFGGESRIQYTALGDPMNTASRLEAANKALGTHLLVSSEALAAVRDHEFRPMGRIRVRGRTTPIDVFDFQPDFPATARLELKRAVAAFAAGDAGALADIERVAAAFPADVPLQGLVDRSRRAGPGNAYSV
jgi:adenylate cyclase